jgi:hypothetical protein
MCPSLPIGIDERINRGFTQPVGQAIAIRHGLDAMCGQPIVVSLTCNADHFCPGPPGQLDRDRADPARGT